MSIAPAPTAPAAPFGGGGPAVTRVRPEATTGDIPTGQLSAALPRRQSLGGRSGKEEPTYTALYWHSSAITGHSLIVALLFSACIWGASRLSWTSWTVSAHDGGRLRMTTEEGRAPSSSSDPSAAELPRLNPWLRIVLVELGMFAMIAFYALNSAREENPANCTGRAFGILTLRTGVVWCMLPVGLVYVALNRLLDDPDAQTFYFVDTLCFFACIITWGVKDARARKALRRRLIGTAFKKKPRRAKKRALWQVLLPLLCVASTFFGFALGIVPLYQRASVGGKLAIVLVLVPLVSELSLSFLRINSGATKTDALGRPKNTALEMQTVRHRHTPTPHSPT